MQMQIKQKAVRENIEHFKEWAQTYSAGASDDKVILFPLYLNRSNGEIRFVKTGTDEGVMSEMWKELYLRMDLSQVSMEQPFVEILDEKNEKVFQINDLSPIALKIILETLQILNQLIRGLEHKEALGFILQELATISLTGAGEGERDLVLEAWYQLDRFGAEQLLLIQREGTYLFRKDFYAEILEGHLKKKHQKPVQCITLTFLEKKHKITDKTLVYLDSQWQIYDDDVSLRGMRFPSIASVLESVRGCREPLRRI